MRFQNKFKTDEHRNVYKACSKKVDRIYFGSLLIVDVNT